VYARTQKRMHIETRVQHFDTRESGISNFPVSFLHVDSVIRRFHIFPGTESARIPKGYLARISAYADHPNANVDRSG
jgi:hypothetical protein